LLEADEIPYEYREYREDPLRESEIRDVLAMLGVGPKQVLRTRDAAFAKIGLTGDEDDDTLIAHMAAHPTLLQRPIAILGNRAVVGRPPANVLQLARSG